MSRLDYCRYCDNKINSLKEIGVAKLTSYGTIITYLFCSTNCRDSYFK